jgi:hypothetical protein
VFSKTIEEKSKSFLTVFTASSIDKSFTSVTGSSFVSPSSMISSLFSLSRVLGWSLLLVPPSVSLGSSSTTTSSSLLSSAFLSASAASKEAASSVSAAS